MLRNVLRRSRYAEAFELESVLRAKEEQVDDMTPEKLRKQLKYANNVIKANGKVISKMEGKINMMNKENTELRMENTW
jgi:hypothetical protein